MATIAKIKLSDSTSGRGIKVVPTATAGQDIHTAVAGGSDIDEIWLCASNLHTTAVTLTLEWGGVTSPNDLIEITIGTEAGLVLVAPGLLIKGNASTALIVKAFAATTNVITIHGYVNQITA